MIEIYLLEQLVGISEYSTLSEAAEHLHITQPTLTRSIRKLEKLLGAELFKREKNRIYINDTGRLAVKYAKRILESENEMINAIGSLERSRHTISIGSCAPAPHLIIEPKLKRAYPQMQITAEIRPEPELIDGLKRGNFQLITLTNVITEKGLYCKKIGTEHLRLSVLPAHPASAMDSVSFADINGGSYIVHKTLGIWEDIVCKHMPNARFIAQSGADEYAEVVNSSSLPTFDSDWGVIIYGQNTNRVSVPISDDAAKMTFYAVYKEIDRRRFDKLIDIEF
ncbi:MAG: LysR family transcriptional regulator [Oscillospiraceae bacterium]|nr:LysR family transcriptional regulator [Oscillospiraceae bacterium]